MVGIEKGDGAVTQNLAPSPSPGPAQHLAGSARAGLRFTGGWSADPSPPPIIRAVSAQVTRGDFARYDWGVDPTGPRAYGAHGPKNLQ